MGREDDLLATANAVQRAVSLIKRRTREVRTVELSLPEAMVLSRLDRNGPDTVSGLARWEQITPQAMGSTVAGLQARGLLRRIPDPHDGRRQLLSLSEAGTDVLHRVRDEQARKFVRALAENFTSEEIAEIGRVAPLIERLAEFL